VAWRARGLARAWRLTPDHLTPERLNGTWGPAFADSCLV